MTILNEDKLETLQDVLVAAFNEAYKTVETTNSEAMSKVTGNVSMPGLF